MTDTAEAAATESIVAGCLQRWCGGYRRLRAETILHKCVCIALIAAVQESCSASSVSDYQSLQRLGIPPDVPRNPQPPPLHWTARSKITVTRWHLCMHVLRLPAEELAGSLRWENRSWQPFISLSGSRLHWLLVSVSAGDGGRLRFLFIFPIVLSSVSPFASLSLSIGGALAPRNSSVTLTPALGNPLSKTQSPLSSQHTPCSNSFHTSAPTFTQRLAGAP